MKALLFEARPSPEGKRSEVLPLLPHLTLQEVAVPELPGTEWVVIKSALTGICGSDLGLLQGKSLPAAETYASLPFVPGHELFGRVEETGGNATGLVRGQRVAVDPTLACPERGFSDLCGGLRVACSRPAAPAW